MQKKTKIVGVLNITIQKLEIAATCGTITIGTVSDTAIGRTNRLIRFISLTKNFDNSSLF